MEITTELMQGLVKGGAYAAVAVAAIGSALGTGAAGQAAVGAMKKCYGQNKPAPFMLVGFTGFPMSQTLYGFILMLSLKALPPESWPQAILAGIFGGLGMAISAWLQGKAAAAACDSLAETGKGTTNYIAVLGIIETVAIFALVFYFLV